MRNYLLLTLAILSFVFFLLWQRASLEHARTQGNYMALMDTARKYRIGDSLSGLSVAVLEIKIAELRQLRKNDVQLISDLGLRLSRVNSLASFSTKGLYSLSMVGDSVWRQGNAYLNFRAEKRKDSLKVDFVVRDTITQILHRIPKFKFLGIWFGTKGVRQEIVSVNPNTEIVAAQYLKIVR